jgi:hypothetical protein
VCRQSKLITNLQSLPARFICTLLGAGCSSTHFNRISIFLFSMSTVIQSMESSLGIQSIILKPFAYRLRLYLPNFIVIPYFPCPSYPMNAVVTIVLVSLTLFLVNCFSIKGSSIPSHQSPYNFLSPEFANVPPKCHSKCSQNSY